MDDYLMLTLQWQINLNFTLQYFQIDAESELVDKTMWGDLESESESESEEEEEEVKGDDDGLVTPAEG